MDLSFLFAVIFKLHHLLASTHVPHYTLSLDSTCPDEEPVEQQKEVVQITRDIENVPPLHESHAFWVFLVTNDEADARGLII